MAKCDRSSVAKDEAIIRSRPIESLRSVFSRFNRNFHSREGSPTARAARDSVEHQCRGTGQKTVTGHSTVVDEQFRNVTGENYDACSNIQLAGSRRSFGAKVPRGLCALRSHARAIWWISRVSKAVQSRNRNIRPSGNNVQFKVIISLHSANPRKSAAQHSRSNSSLESFASNCRVNPAIP